MHFLRAGRRRPPQRRLLGETTGGSIRVNARAFFIFSIVIGHPSLSRKTRGKVIRLVSLQTRIFATATFG